MDWLVWSLTDSLAYCLSFSPGLFNFMNTHEAGTAAQVYSRANTFVMYGVGTLEMVGGKHKSTWNLPVPPGGLFYRVAVPRPGPPLSLRCAARLMPRPS